MGRCVRWIREGSYCRAHSRKHVTNGVADLADPSSSPDWTAEEAIRAAELKAVDVAIEAIRTASNVLEAMPPGDYRDDRHWP